MLKSSSEDFWIKVQQDTFKPHSKKILQYTFSYDMSILQQVYHSKIIGQPVKPFIYHMILRGNMYRKRLHLVKTFPSLVYHEEGLSQLLSNIIIESKEKMQYKGVNIKNIVEDMTMVILVMIDLIHQEKTNVIDLPSFFEAIKDMKLMEFILASYYSELLITNRIYNVVVSNNYFCMWMVAMLLFLDFKMNEFDKEIPRYMGNRFLTLGGLDCILQFFALFDTCSSELSSYILSQLTLSSENANKIVDAIDKYALTLIAKPGNIKVLNSLSFNILPLLLSNRETIKTPTKFIHTILLFLFNSPASWYNEKNPMLKSILRLISYFDDLHWINVDEMMFAIEVIVRKVIKVNGNLNDQLLMLSDKLFWYVAPYIQKNSFLPFEPPKFIKASAIKYGFHHPAVFERDVIYLYKNQTTKKAIFTHLIETTLPNSLKTYWKEYQQPMQWQKLSAIFLFGVYYMQVALERPLAPFVLNNYGDINREHYQLDHLAKVFPLSHFERVLKELHYIQYEEEDYRIVAMLYVLFEKKVPSWLAALLKKPHPTLETIKSWFFLNYKDTLKVDVSEMGELSPDLSSYYKRMSKSKRVVSTIRYSMKTSLSDYLDLPMNYLQILTYFGFDLESFLGDFRVPYDFPIIKSIQEKHDKLPPLGLTKKSKKQVLVQTKVDFPERVLKSIFSCFSFFQLPQLWLVSKKWHAVFFSSDFWIDKSSIRIASTLGKEYFLPGTFDNLLNDTPTKDTFTKINYILTDLTMRIKFCHFRYRFFEHFYSMNQRKGLNFLLSHISVRQIVSKTNPATTNIHFQLSFDVSNVLPMVHFYFIVLNKGAPCIEMGIIPISNNFRRTDIVFDPSIEFSHRIPLFTAMTSNSDINNVHINEDALEKFTNDVIENYQSYFKLKASLSTQKLNNNVSIRFDPNCQSGLFELGPLHFRHEDRASVLNYIENDTVFDESILQFINSDVILAILLSSHDSQLPDVAAFRNQLALQREKKICHNNDGIGSNPE